MNMGKFNIGEIVHCTTERDGNVIASRGVVTAADNNTVTLCVGLEIGKQYSLKPYDAVDNHHGIGRSTWDRLAKKPLTLEGYTDEGNPRLREPGRMTWFVEFDAVIDYVPLYNSKVVCVDNAGQSRRYVVGKIYTFENGYMANEYDTQPKSRPIKDFADWKDFSDAKWVEIVD